MIELIILVGIFWIFFTTLRANLSHFRKGPPGPFQWPIIGNMGNIFLAHPKHVHLALEILARKYGDVMSIKYGVHQQVILSSFKAMKDLLTTDEVSGRYLFPMSTDRSFEKELGILSTSGDIWRETRRFTMRGLRDFGIGRKQSMDMILHEELKELIFQLKSSLKENKGIVKIHNNFTLSITNIVWAVMAGYRFSHDDESLKKMLSFNDKINTAFNYNNVYIPFPKLRKWFPKLVKFDQHMKAYKELQDFIQELLNKFREDIRNREELVGDKPRNLIEMLLRKQDRDPADEIFSDENIIMILLDLFLAGSETTSNTLSYCVLYMILHPDSQRKIEKEISQIVTDGKDLSASDVQRMPYTKAFIFETFRLSNVIPMPLARKTMTDVVYKGFLIPKGTCVVYNNQTNLYDKEFWGDPEVFRPERFLDEENNLVNTERITVFGFGKRICIGESLAWDSAFLYLTTLVRNFTFECVPGEQKPLLNDPREGYFTLAPKPFNVLIQNKI